MTREEAIYELINTHKYFYDDDRLDEAIDMAIEFLSALSINDVKRKICDEICYYAEVCESKKTLENQCESCFLNILSAVPMRSMCEVDAKCDTCKHNSKEWDSVECDSCCGNNSHYEPSDLISRADVLGYIERVTNGGLGRNKSLDYIGKYVERMPSVSTERVVRCKDCDYQKNDGDVTRYNWCKIHQCSVDDTDFCSWAKMKGVE